MSVTSLGISLDKYNSIRLWASRSEDWACLAISGNDASYEIRMQRAHVKALHDQAPNVLAGLDRTAVEDEACARAENASQQAVDAATAALGLAAAAERAGVPDLAVQLRKALANSTAAAATVDATVRAFKHAAAEADSATESLLYITAEVEAALRRKRDNRPAELVTS